MNHKLMALVVALLMTTEADARRTWPVPSLATSCTVCDSTERVDWGNGTERSVIEVSGAGYQPGQTVRVTWSDANGPLWSFDVTALADGSFGMLWTDVPVGGYTVTASQPLNKNRWAEVAELEVTVL